MSAMNTSAQQIEEKRSTAREPYHYVGAGLPNVYLVGVEYRVDGASGEQSADIPCLSGLLEAIAEALLKKQASLTGDELRFFRKRLRLASKEFAQIVGVTSEQYSRVENGATLTPTVDRLVRLLYAVRAKLTPEVVEGVARGAWQAEVTHEERIVASKDADHQWIVQTEAA